MFDSQNRDQWYMGISDNDDSMRHTEIDIAVSISETYKQYQSGGFTSMEESAWEG